VPGALACPSCGVIYARFRARPPLAKPIAPKVRSRHAPIASARLEELLSFAARTVESGVPLASLASTGALATLPRPAGEKLDADLRAGVPLSQSLDELRALDVGSRALIRAGELHGGIPEALRAVAARLAHRRKVRVSLLMAAAYPVLLVLAAAVVLPLPIAFREGVGAVRRRLIEGIARHGVAVRASATRSSAARPRSRPALRWPWLAARCTRGCSTAATTGAFASGARAGRCY